MMPESTYPLNVTVNGQMQSAHVTARLLLSDFIRHELGLHGTHVACEQGACGACTVLINGQLARSCVTLALQVQGDDVRTIESLTVGDELHPVQESFRRCHGLQCGFCTPGFVLATEALLLENPDPTEDEIREYLSGNICRCTGYVGIVEAVKQAALKASAAEGDSQ